MLLGARAWRIGGRLAGAAAVAATATGVGLSGSCKSKPEGLTQLREQEFTLADHYHGKARVRVLRVRHDGDHHSVQEYSVQTRLFSPDYARVFTHEDNAGLVATDTQKNTVYVLAKRSSARTPEGFGVDLARHLLLEYPILSAVEVDVTEDLWDRVAAPSDGTPHEHGFMKRGPEHATATVRMTRENPHAPEVVSGLQGLTVLKTTQSGFEEYHVDKYTLLPPTKERCLATEMKVEWRYAPPSGKKSEERSIDYGLVRETLRKELLHGFYGPAKGGVYSASLQATIYDAGCLVLAALPRVSSISIYTPNIHMIPFQQLKAFGDAFEDDVFVATSDPAGTIHCTVAR